MLNRVALVVFGLGSLAFGEQLPLRTFTTTEGLAHNHINRIRQDSRGFLWFATDGGLSRFDGREFTSYTVADGLPHPWVNDFLQARDGTYWAATDGGVVRFNPKGMSLRERKPEPGPPMFEVFVPPGPGDARRVNALAEERDGSFLCATYDGMYRLLRLAGKVEFERVEIGLPPGGYEGRLVNNITAARRGGWWLAARHGLFRLFEDGRAARFTTANGLTDDFIEAVTEDSLGRIWAGTRIRGFCQIRQDVPLKGRIVERCYTTADGLPDNDVRTIFQNSDGAFWIGTAGGLSEFYPERKKRWFRNYSGRNGLPDQHVLKLAEDSDGNLWIGTMYDGVMKMPREGFVTFGEQDGFHTTRNEWIFETRAGELVIMPDIDARPFIQVFDGTRFQSVSLNIAVPLDEFIPHRIGALQDHTEEWWIGSSHGLFRFPKSASVRTLVRLQPGAVYSTGVGSGDHTIEVLFEDLNGNLWISSHQTGDPAAEHGELTEWDRTSGTFHNFADASSFLKQSPARAFQEDNFGTLWIGLMYDAGLVRRRHGRFEPIRAPEGTFRGDVEALHLDHSGRLWAATSQSGLIRIDHPEADDPRVTRYSEAQGLSSNGVHSITEDQWGRMYAGTDSGVDRVNPATGSIRHFTSSDGLGQGSVLLAYRDRYGALWFVGNATASRLTPAPDKAPPVRTTVISSLRIMGIRYPLSALGETDLQGVHIGPGLNEIQLDFQSPEFVPGVGLQYQYKLEGADTKWSERTSERAVRYANLSPGAYRFLVRAVDSGGATSAPASVSIQVLAPFWRRWWFLALALSSALTIGYAAHRYRVSQLLALQRVRTRIATDLHDDIGSSLSQIAILSEVAQRRANGQFPNLSEPLADIGSISREVVESMSDIVWSIDPERDQLHELCSRMRRFATDVLGSRGIRLRFEADHEDVPLEPDLRRQVFLVLKEAVHNIVRHSGCTEAAISFRIEGRSLRMRVWDNGSGLPMQTAEPGHGLRSMRKRAASIGGEIEISSVPEKGTTVELMVPLSDRVR